MLVILRNSVTILLCIGGLKMKKLFAEFKAFVNKGNALSLAIGVILGASFTAIVTAINQKIISPLIGLLLGDNDLSESLVTVLKTSVDPETGETIITNAIYWGAFIQTVIDFALTAVILFAIFKIAGKFTSALKKAADMEEWIDFKLEKGIKLTKREKLFKEKLDQEKKAKEEAEKNKVVEPTFEEKQLALLQSINENLAKLKK